MVGAAEAGRGWKGEDIIACEDDAAVNRASVFIADILSLLTFRPSMIP